MESKETFTAEEFARAAALLYAVLRLGEVPEEFRRGWVTGQVYLAEALGIDREGLDLPAPVELGERAPGAA